MDQNIPPVYSGYLLIPPGRKLLLKKSWQQKYCLLFKANKFGIERLEIFDSIDDTTKEAPTRILILKNAIKIASSSPTHFDVTIKGDQSVHRFEALDIQAKNEWVNALQSVAFPDDASKITSIEEDNDLYCSSAEGVFEVRIASSPASTRCGISNKSYTLILTTAAMQLREPNTNALLYIWPYRYIRRYGCKNGRFTFEAGRNCETGEGTFFLEHPKQKQIFQCLSSKMVALKHHLLKGGDSPILECGDSQLHAALNMEARSRSPLPPSPTTLHDIESSNVSTKTSMSFIENDLKPTKIAAHLKPLKPPRKMLSKNKESPKEAKVLAAVNSPASDYEPIDKYDHVEYRSDAWKTMGVDEVNHTENHDDDEDAEYLSWGAAKRAVGAVQPVAVAPTIITHSTSSLEDDQYDKLNFFGSSCKLNVKSGYKQVSPAPPVAAGAPTVPSFNDYDVVQSTFEGIRLADDSHLGYALIRKEPAKDDSVNHHFHNNEPYAVISKPKRV